MTQVDAAPQAAPPPRALPYDPTDPNFHADPYAVYRGILARSGKVLRTSSGALAVLGYREITQLMKDNRFGRGDGPGVLDTLLDTPGGKAKVFMFMDPPDHTRIRKLVTKVFTPKMVEKLRPRTEATLAALLAKAREESTDGTIDLVSAVFGPLTVHVINEMVGVPDKYLDRCIEFASGARRGLDPTPTLTPDQKARRDAARAGYVEIVQELIEQRRERPTGDLMSDLIAVEQDGDRLSQVELITTGAIIFLAGFTATPASLSLSTYALLSHPDQRAWLRDNPDRIVPATEELMRWDSLVHLSNRTVLEPVEVFGHEMEPGQEVFMIEGAANRDPEIWDDPDELILNRPTQPSLGFGHGIHYCVAAPLSRMVNQTVLSALSGLDVELASATPPPPSGAISMRSYDELRVVVRH